jgi:LysR family transcriptional regulator, carnitine catabolism transcriptional activator
MEIWQLNTFKVVANTLHFTRASKELNLTQSAVSYQIKSLEEELGVRLFSRDKRKVSLTSQGDRVLDYANKMLDQIEVMRREIDENKESLEGLLKVVAVPRSLNNPFIEIRREFHKLYPGIDLRFEAVLESEAVFDNVRKGISDIGFTTRNKDFRDLLPIPYGKFEMVFVVGKTHRLANVKTVGFNDLQAEEWILFEEESWLRRKSDEMFLEHNFKPKKITDSNDGNVVSSLIKEGEGVGFLPSWGIVDILEENKLAEVKIKGVKSNTPINIVILPESRSKLVSVLINYLLDKKVKGIDLYNK